MAYDVRVILSRVPSTRWMEGTNIVCVLKFEFNIMSKILNVDLYSYKDFLFQLYAAFSVQTVN